MRTNLAEIGLNDEYSAGTGSVTVGRIEFPPIAVLFPRGSKIHEDIFPREVTVRLFSDAQNQLCRPPSRHLKVENGQFSQVLIRGKTRSEIEAAAHQVLNPIFKKLIDDPARFSGMAIRVDVTQPHPYIDMNISSPPHKARVPSDLKLLGPLHDELAWYIVSTASKKIDPCPCP